MPISDFSGTWTALITPFTDDNRVDYDGLNKNIEFQINQGITGILPVGTTGESPTLSTNEHDQVVKKACEFAGNRCGVLAGTGSNSTMEALEHTKHALESGIDRVLLIDCYYNGPSSFELRENYYSVILEEFSQVKIVIYVIPGRTGTAISPVDIALLNEKYGRVLAIKEATGNLTRMAEERSLMPEISIMSGDDDKTYQMMTDHGILASGVISVISNLAPRPVSQMVEALLSGDQEKGKELEEKLKPLFSMVTVKAKSYRILKNEKKVEIEDRFRNPLAIKTLMKALGMPSGLPRQPLGKMTTEGIKIVRENLNRVHRDSPEILKPIEDFYGVSIEERLNNNNIWENLTFSG